MERERGVGFIFWFIVIALMFGVINLTLTKIDSYVVRRGCIETIENNTITIVDTSNTLWQYVDEKGKFNKWDNVKIVINNNNTINTIEDDVILKITLDK